jgi:hypothetical protein
MASNSVVGSVFLLGQGGTIQEGVFISSASRLYKGDTVAVPVTATTTATLAAWYSVSDNSFYAILQEGIGLIETVTAKADCTRLLWRTKLKP